MIVVVGQGGLVALGGQHRWGMLLLVAGTTREWAVWEWRVLVVWLCTWYVARVGLCVQVRRALRGCFALRYLTVCGEQGVASSPVGGGVCPHVGMLMCCRYVCWQYMRPFATLVMAVRSIYAAVAHGSSAYTATGPSRRQMPSVKRPGVGLWVGVFRLAYSGQCWNWSHFSSSRCLHMHLAYLVGV